MIRFGYACTALVTATFHRLWWSLHTLLLLFPAAAIALFVLRWRDRFPQQQPEEIIRTFATFSEVVVIYMFASFLVPVVALSFGTTGLGGDREEGTLVFLLTRGIPRWSISLGKLAATLPLVAVFSLAAFGVTCRLAGPAGELAWQAFLGPIFWGAVAYGCFFHLLAALVRYPTVVAVVYALFVETLLGNLPGVIKQLSISFYIRSWIYQVGQPWGVEAPETFLPVSARSCAWTLMAVAAASVLLSLWVLQRKEYIEKEA